MGHRMGSAPAPGRSSPSCTPAASSAAAPGAGGYCAVQSVTGLKLLYQLRLLPVLQGGAGGGRRAGLLWAVSGASSAD